MLCDVLDCCHNVYYVQVRLGSHEVAALMTRYRRNCTDLQVSLVLELTSSTLLVVGHRFTIFKGIYAPDALWLRVHPPMSLPV